MIPRSFGESTLSSSKDLVSEILRDRLVFERAFGFYKAVSDNVGHRGAFRWFFSLKFLVQTTAFFRFGFCTISTTFEGLLCRPPILGGSLGGPQYVGGFNRGSLGGPPECKDDFPRSQNFATS